MSNLLHCLNVDAEMREMLGQLGVQHHVVLGVRVDV